MSISLNQHRDLGGMSFDPDAARAVGGGYDVKNPNTAREDCARICAGYSYMGLQWTDQCFCGNTFGAQGPADDCGEEGAECADGVVTENRGGACLSCEGSCSNQNAVFAVINEETEQTLGDPIGSITSTANGVVSNPPGWYLPSSAGCTDSFVDLGQGFCRASGGQKLESRVKDFVETEAACVASCLAEESRLCIGYSYANRANTYSNKRCFIYGAGFSIGYPEFNTGSGPYPEWHGDTQPGTEIAEIRSRDDVTCKRRQCDSLRGKGR